MPLLLVSLRATGARPNGSEKQQPHKPVKSYCTVSSQRDALTGKRSNDSTNVSPIKLPKTPNGKLATVNLLYHAPRAYPIYQTVGYGLPSIRLAS